MSVRKRTWKTSKGETKEAWVVAYSDQDGERHIKTFDRKKDAEAYHDTVRIDVRKGLHTAPSKSLTVKEAADNWIKDSEAEGCEETTIQQYRQHVVLHILPRVRKDKLAQLTPDDIKAFRDDLLANVSRSMARKVMTSFKSLLKGANYVHVASKVSIRRNERDQRKVEVGRDIPTSEEVRRIIAAASDERLRAVLLTAALTGLRASELRGLRWSDIDLKAGELHVRQRADRRNKIGAPKSAAGTRTIPLAPDVLSALKVWRLACPKGEGDIVFPSSTGRIEHHKNMWRAVKAVMAKANVVNKRGAPKYGLHSFRHFFASWCINPKDRGGRELPAKMVQVLLGHSSIKMTLDVYGHLFPRGDDRAELAAAARALLLA